MESYPYKIVHLDISGDVVFPPKEEAGGLYIVFWWKDTPVGDWYVQKGQRYDSTVFEQEVKDRRSKVERFLQQAGPLKANNEATLSVVICTRNRTKDLEKCLRSLQQQTCRPSEIVVVDNAPDDEGTYTLTKNMAGVKYVREPQKGLDIARNTGARNASSDIIAYTDDDVIAHPKWIENVKTSFADPAVMAMTGLVIAAELKTESQQIFEKYWSFNRGYSDKYYDHAYYLKHLKSGPPVWEIGAGANMAFRREVFEKAGYFDVRLDVGAAGCNGDSEMWFRILAGKGTIHYNPRAVTFHHHRTDIASLKRQIYYYMRGFAAAALIQQQTDVRLNYTTHLFRTLPKNYLKRTIKGFPHYKSRYRTLFVEMKGLVSGIVYYHQHKQKVNG